MRILAGIAPRDVDLECVAWDITKPRQPIFGSELFGEVELVQVKDKDDAARRKFFGSPSFRINGVDLWNEERETCSLSCRVYSTPEGMEGSPSVAMLQEVVRRIIRDKNPSTSLALDSISP